MATDKLVDFDHVTDYISREAALACFSDWIDRYGHEHTADEMVEYQRIEELPAADVRPMVRGKWEKHEDFDTYGGGRFVEWVCSECDKRLRGDWVIRNSHIEETPTENFCPNCGANMRGEHCSQLRDGTEGG